MEGFAFYAFALYALEGFAFCAFAFYNLRCFLLEGGPWDSATRGTNAATVTTRSPLPVLVRKPESKPGAVQSLKRAPAG